MADTRVLLLTHALAAGLGYGLAPRELLETEVNHSGFFEVDTKRVLAAAVESLRAENRLLVYSYKGLAAVSVERDGPLWLDGRQDLIVPAQVGYYVNLSGLTPDDISYDEPAGLITVRLPPLLMGDVAFEPEGARTFNGGLLTFSDTQVEELRKLNYASARRAFVKQAQGPSLVDGAKRHSAENLERQFRLGLAIAGRPGIRVAVRFRAP
jgi:hypothetical protein